MNFIDRRSRLPHTVFIDHSASDDDLTLLPTLRYADKIREVRLTLADLTDRALEPLALLPKLECLWLESEGFTDKGLESVGRILTLRELRISWTSINGSGLTHLRGLKHLRKLHLCFGHTALGAGLEALQELSALTELSIMGSELEAAVFAGLGTLAQVEKLDLSNCRAQPEVSGADMIGIRKMTGLRSLEMHASSLAPAIVPHLATLLALEDLSLTPPKLSAADVAALNALCNLRKLSLPYVPDEGIKSLTALSKLEELSIDTWSLPPAIVAQLMAVAPGLKISYATMNYDK